MPRRRTIYQTRFDPRKRRIDLEAVLKSEGSDRSWRFERLAESVGFGRTAALAIVKIIVQPVAWRHSPLAHGPIRRAIVVFPFDLHKNAVLRGLGSHRAEFEGYHKGYTKAWSVTIYTDGAAEKLVRLLLKHFDALIIDDLGRTAIVHF